MTVSAALEGGERSGAPREKGERRGRMEGTEVRKGEKELNI